MKLVEIDVTDVDCTSLPPSDGGDGCDAGVPVQCLMSHNGDKGCGKWSDNLHDLSALACSSDVCACGNRLLSRDPNATGYRLYLGQVVYFFRSVVLPLLLSHLSCVFFFLLSFQPLFGPSLLVVVCLIRILSPPSRLTLTSISSYIT